MKSPADLVPLFVREFELCRVGPSDVVAVLSESRTRPEYVESSLAAARVLGASAYEIRVGTLGSDVSTVTRGIVGGVPALSRESPLLTAVGAALVNSTFVVDLVPDTILHLPLREELKRSGARILTIVEPPDALERMFPTEEIRQSVVAATARLTGIRELHLTSGAGTDLLYEFAENSHANGQIGFVEQPGKWDHWPSALISAYPRNANGTVIVDVGDVILHWKRYVQAPIQLTVEDNAITAIEGGLDAALLRDYLESWDDPDVYAVSHVGFGMHPNAQWTALAFYEPHETLGMDARCTRGGFIFSTGPDRNIGRWVQSHIDIPLRGCTVTVDGDAILDNGALVELVG